MANFNKVLLLGNLTRDVDIRHTQSGTSVGKFGLAVNRKTTTKSGEQKESVCFVDCVAFGKTAEVLGQYISKGDPLFLEGRLTFNQWQGQDGGKRSKHEVVVENFQFIGGGGGRNGSGRGSAKPERIDGDDDQVKYDDIPF